MASWRFSRDETGESKQKAAIVALYDELRPSLYGNLICLGLTPQEADDIIQEAFLNLFQHLETGAKVNHPRRWIFRVTPNLSRSLQRRERRLVPDAQSHDQRNALEPFFRREHLKRVTEAVAQLPEQTAPMPEFRNRI